MDTTPALCCGAPTLPCTSPRVQGAGSRSIHPSREGRPSSTPAWLATSAGRCRTATASTTPVRAKDRLAEMGVHQSLYDFGRGYTAVVFRTPLPTQDVKIGHSFSNPVVLGPEASLIFFSMIRDPPDLGFFPTGDLFG